MFSLLKKIIKIVVNYFGWALIKINRKGPKSFVYEKPDTESIKNITSSTGILHLGAHRGKEALVYNWFNKRVLWIEANPEIFSDLKNHIKFFYDQKAMNFLVGDKNIDDVDFFISNKDASCSSIFDLSPDVKKNKLWKKHNLKILKKIKLNMKTLDKIFNENAIKIKNYNHWIIDLQGAELQALHGAKKSLKYCRSINVEISKKKYYDGESTEWLILKKFLKKKGFKLRVKPQSNHCDVLFIKN